MFRYLSARSSDNNHPASLQLLNWHLSSLRITLHVRKPTFSQMFPFVLNCLFYKDVITSQKDEKTESSKHL